MGPELTSEEQSSPSQLARGAGGGQGTCFISTDKLISRGSAQLFLDKRRKKEPGAGDESLGQVNCETEREFPVATNSFLFKEPKCWPNPLGLPGKACDPNVENQTPGWTRGGLLGSGVALGKGPSAPPMTVPPTGSMIPTCCQHGLRSSEPRLRPLCLLFPTHSFVFAELSTYYVPGLGDWGGRWGNKK